MKRLLSISLLFLLLFTMPVFAEELDPPETISISEEIVISESLSDDSIDYITILNDIKAIELDNQELIAQQTVATLIIMYILAILSVMIYVYLLIIIIRRLAKILGFGLL